MTVRGGALEVSVGRFSYGERPVLEAVSFAVPSGELLAVLGPNGSGKSTLFRLLTGSADLADGKIACGGKDISSLSVGERARIFSLMAQMRDLYFPYTALEVVLMGRAMKAEDGFFENRSGIERALAVLARVGVAELSRRRIDRLSAGERQRVFLARCLHQDTPVILLDEPTNFLDIKAQADLESVIEESHRREGKTLVLITHDLNQALRLADRVLLLREGKTVGFGAPADVLNPDRIFQAYGVRMRWTGVQPDGENYLIPERNGQLPKGVAAEAPRGTAAR